MRTTLTIDDDVAVQLERENRRTGEPMKQTINRVLRTGLAQVSPGAERKPFKVKTFSLGTPKKWKGLTPKEVLNEMDIEEYQEKLERARHQSSSLRS